MKESTRRAALRYALKATIIVSMSGCYDSHGRGPTLGRPDAPVWADAPPPDAPAAIPDVGPLDCAGLLASLPITDPGPSTIGWHWEATFTDPAVHADPVVGACCVEMDTHLTEADPSTPGEVGSALAMACCEVIVVEQHLVSTSSLGCTPWGPPCPPAMPDDVELA